MSDTALWIAIAVGELLLLAFALLLYAWIRNLSARQRDIAAVKTLVKRVTKARPERERAIRQFLVDQHQLDGDDLARETVRICRAELKLVQEVANLYRQRDVAQLVQFPLAVENAVEPYWGLSGSAASGAGGDDGADGGAGSAELERLREENQSLADELQITMDTMSRMLTEYSAMFAGATPAEISGTAGVAVPGEEADSAEVLPAPADEAFDLSESDLDGPAAEPPPDDGSMADAVAESAPDAGVDATLELGSDPGDDADQVEAPAAGESEPPLDEDGLFNVDLPAPQAEAEDGNADPPTDDSDEKVAI